MNNTEDKYAVVNINNLQIIDSWLDYESANNLTEDNENYGIVPMSEIV